ncbi:Bifunctional solanapyrone synthase [Lachnellula arida]|uniref:Bifunctional solanapyrone synthase n=1 Tax=Lachnellula arida TaxID=1316785 RepID=A0A8T9BLY2_9HELO|nr:Bifunctional solanapyrone synthase [Lachnellula arida]
MASYHILRLFSFCFLLFSSASSIERSTSDPSRCNAINSFLPGKVFFQGDGGYNASDESYFFAEARLRPACIVTPTSATDVATTIQVLGGNEQGSSAPLFAIRGGGLLPNIAAANIDGGVTIDLSAMNLTIVNEDKTIASIGSGARWGNVYRTLDAFTLGIVGARIATAGVGGYFVGGGLSFFSPQKGFGCDNLANIEIVLATGEIVNANASSNADLFTALKGGSNNFGVVTRYDVQVFPQGLYWGGAIEYPPSTIVQQLEAFATFKDPRNFDPYAEVELSFFFSGQSYTVANNMFYTLPIVNASALQPFSDIQPQTLNTMRISNTSDFAEEIVAFQPSNPQGFFATTVFRTSLPLIQRIFSLWNDTTPLLQNVTGLLYNLDLQSVPTFIPGNSLGLENAAANGSNHTGSLTICLLSNYWADTADSPTMIFVTQNLLTQMKDAAKEQGLDERWEYLNYASEFQHPIESYGAASQANMRAVSKKYDPNCVFQKQVPGGFKLFTHI